MKRKKRSYGRGRIWQRGRIWWISYCENGVEQRESSKSTAYAVALDLLRKRQGEQEAGTLLLAQARTFTVNDALALLKSDYTEKKRDSMPALKGHIATWKKAMGDLELSRANDYALLEEQSRLWLQAGDTTPATINRRMASLRRASRLAVRCKLAARPIEVPHLTEAPPRDGFLAPADFATLASKLPKGLSLFVRFLYATGMRVGEARQLEWRDVDGTVIRVRGATAKNKTARTLPVRGEVAAIIADARRHRRLDCPRLFHQGGKPIGDFRKAWKVAAKAAGHPEIRPHDLRRSAVRNLIRSGVPERIAMGITGHKTRAVFDRYNIVSAADLGAALDTVGAFVEKAATKKSTGESSSDRDSDKVSESAPGYGHRSRKRAV